MSSRDKNPHMFTPQKASYNKASHKISSICKTPIKGFSYEENHVLINTSSDRFNGETFMIEVRLSCSKKLVHDD